jgi:two-component system chemotaxis sensor kinase CheA
VIYLIEDSSLLHEFVLEANAHIAQIETGLLHIEEGLADEDVINEIFRAAHSIKGTASFFELNNIVELAHCIENVFGEMREQRLQSSPALIDALLSAVDTLKLLLESPESSDKYDITEKKAALNQLITGSGLNAAREKKAAISAWDLWNELTNVEQSAPIAKEVVEDIFSKTTAVNFPKVNSASNPKKESSEDSVRVNVGLLNDLLTLAGEMVLRRNQLLRLTEAADKESGPLETVAKSIDELTTGLQKKIMQTRMQPIANIFNKFPRIVRDLSHKVEKEVDLKLEGLNVGLDRSLIEALVDPLTHLVRNALDHGIENPNVRKEKNKPLTGTLTLRASQESGRVIVDISDDGAGIDVEKVKKSALKKGLINKSEMASLRQTDVLSLIMRPGFSTSDKITDISGRGVGMDVVKSNIEKLGGKIELFSEKGVGTTFRLLLPLTLAIIGAVIIFENGQSFAIPQANIKELLLVLPDEKGGPKVEEVHNHVVLRLREKLLPLIRLGDILDKTALVQRSIFESVTEDKQALRVVIVKAGKKEYGLVVDAVYDTEEILVKPNEEMVNDCRLYSGATVLGDGKIAMILDTESHHILDKLTFFDTPILKPIEKAVCAEKQYLLLFQCSGSEMLGIDLAMVSRVEEIDITKLKKIGTKYYFTFQGRTTRVIRPEYYLPLSRKKSQPEKVYVIMPKLVKYPIGILAEKVYDAVYTSVSLEQSGVTGKGLLGSALINHELVTLINIHELFAEAVPEYIAVSRHNNVSGAAQKYTVLLAEDTPFFLKVVKSYLEVAGYLVIGVENGRLALDVLRKTSIDVVVSDIEMPIMTGIELVRAIRADEQLKDLPVIALTSLRGEINKEKGLRAGFDMYEYKLDRIRLLDSIQAALCSRGK